MSGKLAGHRRDERYICAGCRICKITSSQTLSFAIGGIFEPEKRARVVPLLYAQVAVFVVEVSFLSKRPYYIHSGT